MRTDFVWVWKITAHGHGTTSRKSSRPVVQRASTSHPIRMLGHGTVTVTARHVRTVTFSQSNEIRSSGHCTLLHLATVPWWRHVTATNRMLYLMPLVKLLRIKILNKKENFKSVLVVVVKWRHPGNVIYIEILLGKGTHLEKVMFKLQGSFATNSFEPAEQLFVLGWQ
jgi:hypothetical protein